MARLPRLRDVLVFGCVLAGTVVAAGGWAWWALVRMPPARPLPAEWIGAVSVLAGTGIPEWRDGAAGRAAFSDPFGVAVAPDGSVLVADAGRAQGIRRISPGGQVFTLAGGAPGYADGPAWMARFDTPSGIAAAADGSIYVADAGNHAVRRIAPSGTVSTLAGGSGPGSTNGIGQTARFNGPLGVALAPDGAVVVADTYNDRIRTIASSGEVRPLAGDGRAGLVDGPAAAARFDTPVGVAVDAAGTVFVADTGNHAVRRIDTEGRVSTVEPLPPGGLFRPVGIAVDSAGTLYVTDEGGRVSAIQPGVSARVVAGQGTPGFATGTGDAARFRAPAGVAVLGEGRLAMADRRNALVLIVEAPARRPFGPPPSPRPRPRFDLDGFAATPLLWPLHPLEGTFEITGTVGEARGGAGSERFHAGLDIRAEEGTSVLAVRDGVVTDPIATTDFGTLNESLRIDSVVYVHQRVGRNRRSVFGDDRLAPVFDDSGVLRRVRVKRGARFRVGERLGTTNAFNHVHLIVGWPREEINPLTARLVRFVDTVQPVIVAGGIHVLDASGVELRARQAGRLLVSGPVRISVDAWDQVDGNRPQRRLGLYRLGYQVLTAAGAPVHGFEQPRETIRFDRLFPDERAPTLAYAPGSGIPFFGGRRTRFLYEVTNTVRDGVAVPGVWDTTALEPGDYVVRVLATDFSGNVAIGNRELAVTVTR